MPLPARIQTAAGIHSPCREEREQTDACRLSGFHTFGYSSLLISISDSYWMGLGFEVAALQLSE